MTEKYLKQVLNFFKNGKTITALGIVGILLIGLSSFFPSKSKETSESQNESYNLEEYRENLEAQIKKTVVTISGDKKASVVITLETGIRYSYASEKEETKSDKTDSQKSDVSEGVKNNYITVKTADGAEEALVVTEYMPQIRGVAVVCNNASDENIVSAIENAVTAALGISSKKVFVTQSAN